MYEMPVGVKLPVNRAELESAIDEMKWTDKVKLKAQTAKLTYDLAKLRAETDAKLVEQKIEDYIEAMPEGKLKNTLAGTVQELGVVAVTLFIIIYIIAEITEVIPDLSNSSFNETLTTVETTTGAALAFMAVAMIIAVASVMLGLLGGFNRGGGPR